jgi:signal peptidase I
MPVRNNQTAQAGPPPLPNWLRVAVIGRNPKVTLARATVLAVTCFIIFKFIFLFIRTEGISMLPTYQDKSVHLVSRVAYLRHEPQRGDVVSIRLAGIHVMYLKRIIGLPGETISFVNGRALIDGQVLDEPYMKFFSDWNLPPEKIGPNEYFVVGDNRTMPPQYHEHGIASRDRIVGKLLL